MDPGRVVARRRHPGHLRAGGREAGALTLASATRSPDQVRREAREVPDSGGRRIPEHPRGPAILPKGRGLEPEHLAAQVTAADAVALRCARARDEDGPLSRCRIVLEGRAPRLHHGPSLPPFSSFSRPRRNVQGAPLARRISLEAHVQQRGPCPRGPVEVPPSDACCLAPPHRDPLHQDQGFAQSGSPAPRRRHAAVHRPAQHPKGRALVRAETAPLPPGPRAEHAAIPHLHHRALVRGHKPASERGRRPKGLPAEDEGRGGPRRPERAAATVALCAGALEKGALDHGRGGVAGEHGAAAPLAERP